MINQQKGLGCVRQLPDSRDKRYVGGLRTSSPQPAFPKHVDLRQFDAPIWDQYNLNSCAAHATAGAIAFIQKRNKATSIRTPSRQFIYYETRKMENTQDSNAGTVIRDNFKAVNASGFCEESEFPYDVTTYKEAPSEDVHRLAQINNIEYHAVEQTERSILHVLASSKPLVFGIVTYSNLMSEATAHSGVLSKPSASDDYVGGHAIMAVGYDLNARTLLIRNSWGEGWGQKGYFTIPLDTYVLDPSLAFDFWTVDMLQQ